MGFSTRMMSILSFVALLIASAVFYLFLQTRVATEKPNGFEGAPAVTSRIPETQAPPEPRVISELPPQIFTETPDGKETKEPPQTVFGQTPSLFFLPAEQPSFFAPLIPAFSQNLFFPVTPPVSSPLSEPSPLTSAAFPVPATSTPEEMYAALTGKPFPEELKAGVPAEDFDSTRRNMIQAGIIKEADFIDFSTAQDIEAFSYAMLEYQVLMGQMTAEEAAQAKTFLSPIYSQMR